VAGLVFYIFVCAIGCFTGVTLSVSFALARDAFSVICDEFAFAIRAKADWSGNGV